MFRNITLSILLFTTTLFYAQVGIGTTEPGEGAMLDVDSDNSGILIPRVELTATNSSTPIAAPTPEIGLMVFNTVTINDVTPGFYYWNGAAWERMASGASKDWALTGNEGTTPGTNFIGTTDNQDLVVATDSNERMRVDNNGNVGIGTSTPAISNDGVEVNKLIVEGAATSTGTSFTYMSLFANTGSGAALSILNEDATNNFPTLNVASYGPEGTGIRGLHLSDSGLGFGVYGHSNSTEGVGVRGTGNYAIEGLGTLEGVYGQGFYGIYGVTTNLTFGYAGLFLGDVGVSNNLWVDGTINGVSDKRVKKNFRTIDNALATINALNPTLYEKNVNIVRNKYGEEKISLKSINKSNIKTERVSSSNKSVDKTEYGFIAQELELILPELVKEKRMDIEGLGEVDLKSVNYIGLIPILTEAIQEQQTIIESQESRIAKLESLVNQLIEKK